MAAPKNLGHGVGKMQGSPMLWSTADDGDWRMRMRFLLGCLLGLIAIAPLAILSARALSVPNLPTVIASVDTRDCAPYNGLNGAGPWCQSGNLEQPTKR
jgi:hypothetical protein